MLKETKDSPVLPTEIKNKIKDLIKSLKDCDLKSLDDSNPF